MNTLIWVSKKSKFHPIRQSVNAEEIFCVKGEILILI